MSDRARIRARAERISSHSRMSELPPDGEDWGARGVGGASRDCGAGMLITLISK